LSALYGCTPLPKAVDIIYSERENENWILFADYITCTLVLQQLQWVLGEKEKVVRNKDPRKKEYWEELSEDTLNSFFPLGILVFKIRDSNLLGTCSNTWAMPPVFKIIFSHLLSYINVYCWTLMCLLRKC
jgi:hypothetical protein